MFEKESEYAGAALVIEQRLRPAHRTDPVALVIEPMYYTTLSPPRCLISSMVLCSLSRLRSPIAKVAVKVHLYWPASVGSSSDHAELFCEIMARAMI